MPILKIFFWDFYASMIVLETDKKGEREGDDVKQTTCLSKSWLLIFKPSAQPNVIRKTWGSTLIRLEDTKRIKCEYSVRLKQWDGTVPYTHVEIWIFLTMKNPFNMIFSSKWRKIGDTLKPVFLKSSSIMQRKQKDYLSDHWRKPSDRFTGQWCGISK